MQTELSDNRVTLMAALLSNPLRLAIVQRLRGGACIVGELVTELGQSQATLSKQLGLLREAGLLACRPDGRCREYGLAEPELVGTVIDALCALGKTSAVRAAECAASRPGLPTA